MMRRWLRAAAALAVALGVLLVFLVVIAVLRGGR